MTEQEQIKKFHTIVNEWFTDHRATCRATGDILDIEWQNPLDIHWRRPDTGNYAMCFIIHRNVVIVTGDVGDAIYGFSQPLTMARLVTFDWHYFWGKCMASETGRKYEQKVPGIKYPVPNVRAIGHFTGLQMAIRQLHARPQP